MWGWPGSGCPTLHEKRVCSPGLQDLDTKLVASKSSDWAIFAPGAFISVYVALV